MQSSIHRLFFCSCLFVAGLCLFVGELAAQDGSSAEKPEPQVYDTPPYEPAPENLQMREWFQDARFGIFIHWGVYSVLEKGEWVMQNDKMSIEEYEKLLPKFNPTEFDAQEWVSLFKRAGAKYITITSKHHDGFCMWDSDATDYNIVDSTPYDKDVLKALAEECERQDMKLFFYYSQVDWHHPEYPAVGKTGQHAGREPGGDFNKYLDYMNAQLSELLSGEYGKLGGIWFDGWWDFRAEDTKEPRDTYKDWKLGETYALIHRHQPQALIGSNHHVLPFEGEDFQMYEKDLPGQNKGGHSKDAEVGDLPLETCDTMNRSWGYNASDDRYKSTRQLVHYLVRAAGYGANFLLNVGPKPDGTIQPEFVETLREIGDWMDQHGDTIYETDAGPIEPQPWGVSTQSRSKVYVHILDWDSTDEQGWLTLTGSKDATFRNLRARDLNDQIEHRRDDQGNLQVKKPEFNGETPIDTILELQL